MKRSNGKAKPPPSTSSSSSSVLGGSGGLLLSNSPPNFPSPGGVGRSTSSSRKSTTPGSHHPPRTRSPPAPPSQPSGFRVDAAAAAAATIRLRVSGLGGRHLIEASPSSTLLDLKTEIERRTALPPPYQRLVARRRRMDDDAMVLGPTLFGGEGNSGGGASAILSMGIGLEDGSSVMLLHSPLYERDREGIEKLTELVGEIDKIDAARRSRDMDDKTVQELIIQVCCKLDCVETNGSEALRTMRKSTIRRAEGVARRSEAARRGVDP
jgi:hypothetical protein